MIDNRNELYSLLNSLGVDVQYQYPDTLIDNNYPKISYYMSGSEDLDYREGQAQYNNFEATIQVWEKQIDGTLNEIHFEVDNLLKENGYKRILFDSVYDQDLKIYNYTFRYIKTLKY